MNSSDVTIIPSLQKHSPDSVFHLLKIVVTTSGNLNGSLSQNVTTFSKVDPSSHRKILCKFSSDFLNTRNAQQESASNERLFALKSTSTFTNISDMKNKNGNFSRLTLNPKPSTIVIPPPSNWNKSKTGE